MPLDFHSIPLWANFAIFGFAAAIVWLAGTRLSRYADVIAERTGLGRAFVGLVLLATATSLPEIATTSTASLDGNAPLAMNNLLGSVVTNTAVLAVADLFVARYALSYITPRPVLLLEGSSVVLLAAVALAGMTVAGLVPVFGIGLWSVLIFGVYLLLVYLLHNYEGQWQPVDLPEATVEEEAREARRQSYGQGSIWPLGLKFAAGSAVILAAGFTLARVGDALAVQTGLGGSFVGFALLALATTLPEVSTTIEAVRLGAYGMAFSNVFGSSAFVLALILPADILYRPGPILAAVEQSSLFAGAAGIVLTAVYLMGLIERKDRTILGLGYDSFAVLVLYAGSLAVMYLLR